MSARWETSPELAAVMLEPDSQMPFYSSDGIDAEDATRLLKEIPKTRLRDRWNSSPTVGTFLRSIAAHPQVRGNRPASAGPVTEVGISGVLIDDPELLTLAPDVELGTMPTFLDECTVEQKTEYYRHLLGCVRESVRRQQWFAVQHRYGIDDALAPPDEIDPVPGLGGRLLLHFWWD
ncbi:hypothetical protein [Pseudactinotalea suaedae]|uniref:hypothetical protein n=1 Tax=Pseudactinotalea suaedae TaxID=1524924 RepID=UPI0012E27FCE|nr:hypothetical protein [Pseudactinotalea suaedae]